MTSAGEAFEQALEAGVAVGDLSRCAGSATLLKAYRRVKRSRFLSYRLFNHALRLEGGPCRSYTVRRLLHEHHGVAVGAHSYGPVLRPRFAPAGLTVGRYSSIGPDLQIFRADHPMDLLSTHPYFYDAAYGCVPETSVRDAPLEIGSDVWIGSRVIVLPGCRRIRDGAVVAAGAVVRRDVLPFELVAGVPARPVRRRFDDGACARILADPWWRRPLADVRQHLASMTVPLAEQGAGHPLVGHDAEAAPPLEQPRQGGGRG